MATLERAIQIAVEAHQGQQDRAGAPYILHPLRVMMRMKSEPERIVAVLHDVVEDSAWTTGRLREEGFTEEILEAVDAVTRRDDETYEQFVERNKSNAIGRRVRIFDLEDKMEMRWTGDKTKRELRRLQRYYRAWRKLKGMDR